MDIGKLNERITFMKLEDVEDEMGQSSKKLVPICTVWASIYPVRGSERYELKKIDSKTTHKCFIRYRDGIDSNCYIMHQGKQYNIESVIDVKMRHKMLEIMCSEHLNKGVKPYERG